MRKLKIIAGLLLFVWFLVGVNIKTQSAVVQGINAANGVCEVYYNGNIECNKMELDNPPRVAIDIIGVDKCEICKNGVKIIKDGDVVIRSSLHNRLDDNVYKLYGKPVERIVFVFNNRKKPIICKIDRTKGRIKIVYGKPSENLNLIERVSLRKFKNYEMVVVLLKGKPSYKLKRKGNAIYLTLNNVSAVKEALQRQNLERESFTVKSISADKTSNNSVEYLITLKDNANLKKYYADNRHLYLIFTSKNANVDSATSHLANNKIENKSKEQLTNNSDVNNNIITTNKLISFDVRDAQLKDIFRVFSQISGLNFIIGDDVKGTLTMKLKDVPLNQAFELILQQEGLVAERKGNIVIIETASRYQKEKMQQLKALKDKEKLERMKNAVTKVINLNYITPDYAIKMVNKLLYNSDKNSGFVVSDVKNNALICHDTAENIAKVEKIIKIIDQKKRAVEIDARIVEISKNFERQLGIQWGGNYFNNKIKSSNAFVGMGGATSTADVSNGLPPAEKFTNNNFIVNLPASLSAAPTSAVTLAVGNVNANYNLDLKLTMGEIEGYTKVLSSPRVVTLDNEPAKIKSGQEIPYQESAGASGATSVSFKDATLSLEVTPHLTKNNQVILDVKVKKDSPDYSHSVGGEPPINKNQVETTVILKDGQTLVIGGLIQRTNEKTVSGVPGLMRIPLLGWLFKTKRLYNPQNELYIFVTPHIISEQ